MKKKILITIFAAAILALTACGRNYAASEPARDSGASNYKMSTTAAAAEEAYEYEADYDDMVPASTPEPQSAAAGSSSERPYSGDVKLIYRADISAETTDLDKTAEEIEKLVESCGGYVESSDINRNSYSSGVYLSGYYTVRVPQDKYFYFLDCMNNNGICNVTNISKSTTDVGAQYADTEARLATYRIKQERLQELLKQAETMEDIITIENALSDVEYQIEYLSSDLKRYDSLINFSTITINLQEVNHESRTADDSSLGERISSSFTNGVAAFASGFEDFVVDVAGAIIPLLIIAAIIVVVVILIVKIVRKYGHGPKQEKKSRKGKTETEEKNGPES